MLNDLSLYTALHPSKVKLMSTFPADKVESTVQKEQISSMQERL